jgi:tetratricopeptide (TPR) repeat protein
MIMKRIIAYLVCFSFLISAAIVFAEVISLIKEYTYQASELDSKTTCRAIALEQVKRELLEELGTYVESTTIVQDAQIDQDEIRTISAGVVQTKVLDEKWDGKYFWLKAEVSADPDEVAAAIEKVRNDQKLAEELAESQAEKEDALREVDRLKAELEQSNADKEKLAQYNQAVNQLQASDSFEQGTAMTVAGDYEGAAKAYDRVIYYRPNDAKAYFLRSIVFIFLGNYQSATNDLDRAMILRPARTKIYYQRAAAYKDIHEHRVINNFSPAQPFTKRPYKPVASKDDSLQRFLNKKQSEHKFVKATPFKPVQRRPTVKRPDKQLQPQKYQIQQKDQPFDRTRVQPDRRIKTTIIPPVTEQNQQLLKQKRDEQYRRELDEKRKSQYYQDQNKPIAGQPVKPDIYRKGDVPQPAHLERKQPIVTPSVDEQRGFRKRDLNQEQQKALQMQRKKEQDDQRVLEMQQRQNLRKKEGSFVREPAKPEVRRQVNVPPPPQPRVERKPPVVQPRRDVYTPKAPQQAQQQKVKTKKQEKDEELEKASPRR